jgi:GNAT superfamily N-acetyltransferase
VVAAPTADDSPTAGWWHCLALGDAGERLWFAVVWSDRHPDGDRVELPVDAALDEVAGEAVCTATYDATGTVTVLHIGDRGAPGAPTLWFAEIRENAAHPPAVNLMAFASDVAAAGTLLDESRLRELPVASEDQVGAIRWYPATGEVDQMYVQPNWRRRHVSGALVGAAAALSYARDWPRLWGDGQRTALGEQVRNASPWRTRTADLTHVAPPMTPATPTTPTTPPAGP